jgi:16S rRNA (cytidine1402-2'-O)-methyltransferase
MSATGKLFVVATPIGNLADLSPRASQVLSDVDVIAAEDTRVTRKLLERSGVSAKLMSYRDANERVLAPKLVERLLDGENIALVSDAGTPCISDPGYRLVSAAQDAGVEVVAVPGPSTVTAFLSVCGLPTDRFAFEGFLPKTGRKRALGAFLGSSTTLVLYESPRRVLGLLADIADVMGECRVAVGRELTKMHEEVLRGTATELVQRLGERASVKGEVVVAIDVRTATVPSDDEVTDADIVQMLDGGKSARDVAAELKARGVSRQRVYSLAGKSGAR